MVVIVVVGFSENRFLHAIPNIENTFPENFPKHTLMSLSPKSSCQPCLLTRLDINSVEHAEGRRKIG